jgi:hypothetical protein
MASAAMARVARRARCGSAGSRNDRGEALDALEDPSRGKASRAAPTAICRARDVERKSRRATDPAGELRLVVAGARHEGRCGATVAVGRSIPGNLQRRWAPFAQVHGQEQGQLPLGSIRPRGYEIHTNPAAPPLLCKMVCRLPPVEVRGESENSGDLFVISVSGSRSRAAPFSICRLTRNRARL